MAFELDLAGGAEVLNEMAAPHVEALAGVVAAVAGEGAEVKTYQTDRAAAKVMVPADAQAIDGVLTKAASALGLAVTPVAPRKSRAKGSKSAARKPAAKKGAAK